MNPTGKRRGDMYKNLHISIEEENSYSIALIGHVSAATTLDIYSHMTDTMQMQAAVNIDRKIGGTNAEKPEVKQIPEETAKPPIPRRRDDTEKG